MSPDRTRRPAAVAGSRRPTAQAKKPSQAYSFALIAAAVLIVAALGATADWLFVHRDPEVTRGAQASMPAVTEQPAAAVATEPAPEVTRAAVDDRPVLSERPAEVPAPTSARTSAPAPAAKDPVPAKPKPAAPAKPVRAAAAPAAKSVKPQTAPREAAPAPALSAAAAPAPVHEVVAAAPAPATKAAPVGPFFEAKDVSESPRIAARVEPKLPAELKARKVHEIIIVRALVSQNGHPSRISVLRKSKTGPQLDDVVVAAVNQWTFSPAKKKGEPVSCWFNFGVTVGAAD